MKTAYDLLIEKLSMQAGLKKIPLNGAFELTSRCNFNCKMCYIHNPSRDKSVVDEATMTVDQAGYRCQGCRYAESGAYRRKYFSQ